MQIPLPARENVERLLKEAESQGDDEAVRSLRLVLEHLEEGQRRVLADVGLAGGAGPDVDYLLGMLATTLVRHGGSVSVTLSVHGVLISGQLTNAKAYFTYVGEQFGRRVPEWSAEEWSDVLETVSASELAPGFLYVRDAAIVTPSGDKIHSREGLWWRVRVKAVDAFMFGTVEGPAEDGPGEK